MNRCETCGRTGSGRIPYTAKQFKAEFKVGDVIIGYSTEKEMLITAIGETRFLYKNNRGHDVWEKKERVAAFSTSNWRKK